MKTSTVKDGSLTILNDVLLVIASRERLSIALKRVVFEPAMCKKFREIQQKCKTPIESVLFYTPSQ